MDYRFVVLGVECHIHLISIPHLCAVPCVCGFIMHMHIIRTYTVKMQLYAFNLAIKVHTHMQVVWRCIRPCSLRSPCITKKFGYYHKSIFVCCKAIPPFGSYPADTFASTAGPPQDYNPSIVTKISYFLFVIHSSVFTRLKFGMSWKKTWSVKLNLCCFLLHKHLNRTPTYVLKHKKIDIIHIKSLSLLLFLSKCNLI